MRDGRRNGNKGWKHCEVHGTNYRGEWGCKKCEIVKARQRAEKAEAEVARLREENNDLRQRFEYELHLETDRLRAALEKVVHLYNESNTTEWDSDPVAEADLKRRWVAAWVEAKLALRQWALGREP